MARAVAKKPQLSVSDRLVLKRALTSLKVWWITPFGAGGELERMEAVVEGLEQAIKILRGHFTNDH